MMDIITGILKIQEANDHGRDVCHVRDAAPMGAWCTPSQRAELELLTHVSVTLLLICFLDFFFFRGWFFAF